MNSEYLYWSAALIFFIGLCGFAKVTADKRAAQALKAKEEFEATEKERILNTPQNENILPIISLLKDHWLDWEVDYRSNYIKAVFKKDIISITAEECIVTLADGSKKQLILADHDQNILINAAYRAYRKLEQKKEEEYKKEWEESQRLKKEEHEREIKKSCEEKLPLHMDAMKCLNKDAVKEKMKNSYSKE